MSSPGIVPNNNVIEKTEFFFGHSPNRKVQMEPSNLFDIGNLTSFEAGNKFGNFTCLNLKLYFCINLDIL